MVKNTFEVKTGIGKLRVYEGEKGYGQVNIDLVVKRNGREYLLPVVVVENPTDPEVETADTRVDATTVYVYGSLNDDEWTDKHVIPNFEVDRVISTYE